MSLNADLDQPLLRHSTGLTRYLWPDSSVIQKLYDQEMSLEDVDTVTISPKFYFSMAHTDTMTFCQRIRELADRYLMLLYPEHGVTEADTWTLDEKLRVMESFAYCERRDPPWSKWASFSCNCVKNIRDCICEHSLFLALLHDNTLEIPTRVDNRRIRVKPPRKKRGRKVEEETDASKSTAKRDESKRVVTMDSSDEVHAFHSHPVPS